MRKLCKLCGKRLDLSQFHLNKMYKDGVDNRCKSCYSEYIREKRWGKCSKCGDDYYKGNGHALCKSCRKPVAKKVQLSPLPRCDRCAFERECKDNIWRETFTPYCFVTAKYHGLYEREQQKRGVVTG